MVTDHKGTCVFLQGTPGAVLGSSRLMLCCCLCWQHGQNVFPKLRCRAGSSFERAVNKSPFLLHSNNSIFLTLLKAGCALLSPCLFSVGWERQKGSMTDPSFLGWMLSPKSSARPWNPIPQRTTYLAHAKKHLLSDRIKQPVMQHSEHQITPYL